MDDEPARDDDAVHVVSGAILRDETCLVAERGEEMSYTSRWELPGGKVEPGEAPEEALRRELREELDVEAVVGVHIASGDVECEGRRFKVDVYEVALTGGWPRPVEHARHGWFRAEELDELDWVAPHLPVVAPVQDHLRRRGAGWPPSPASTARRMNQMAAVAMEWATMPLVMGAAVGASTYAMVMASLSTAYSRSRG